jgi:hypothetical protein
VSFNISHAQGELLAQVRPGVTTVVPAYIADQLRTEITLITCAINSGGSASVDVALYHDDEGTTLNLDNLLSHETRLRLLQDNILFQSQHPGSGIMIKPGGSLGVQTFEIDSVTFSIYGITETLSERVSGRV